MFEAIHGIRKRRSLECIVASVLAAKRGNYPDERNPVRGT